MDNAIAYVAIIVIVYQIVGVNVALNRAQLRVPVTRNSRRIFIAICERVLLSLNSPEIARCATNRGI